MANVGFATISIIPSMKGFGSKLRVGMAGPLASEGAAAGDKAGRSFASTFAKAAVVGTAAVGAVAIGKGLVDAAVESQKVTKQTEAVLKSMGGQAGLTAKDISDLSTRLSMQSGVDDELIQSAENVLLTFGNVRNKLGKGNDIFTQGTQIALDMSVALGTDLQGSVIQVGKALNDPIKGVTALQRVGVSFTEKQKDQIKTLVESGRTLDAQKLILGELQAEFKGSAAAQATSGEKLKVVLGNLQEQLGSYLLPVIEKVAGFLADKLPSAIDATSRAVKPFIAGAKQIFGILFGGDFKGGGPLSEDSPLVDRMFKIRDGFLKVFGGIKEWFEANWPKISEIVREVMDTVGAIVGAAIDIIQTLWANFGNNILELVQRIWPRIQQIIEGALKVIRSVVQVITALIHGDWSGVWEGIKGIVSGAWQAIQGIVGGALEVLRSAIGVVLEVIGSMFKGAWDAITSTVQNAVTGAISFITDHWRGILQILTGPIGLAVTFISDHFNQIVSFVAGLPGRIASAASGMWDGIKNAFKSVINWIIRGWNKLEFKIPGFDPPGPIGKIGGFTLGVPDIPELAADGAIFRQTTGGLVTRIAGKGDEAVIPLPTGWRSMSPLGADHDGERLIVLRIDPTGADSGLASVIAKMLRVDPAFRAAVAAA